MRENNPDELAGREREEDSLGDEVAWKGEGRTEGKEREIK